MNIKEHLFVFSISLFFILILSSIVNGASVSYGNYINKDYNYGIIIPMAWAREELTLPDKHFMYSSKDANTDIKVRAFKTSEENIDTIVHAQTWDLRKVDPRLHKIIETGKISIQKNTLGKLLVFDYRSRRNNFLQRTLISINHGIIYIVECKSPRNTFYKYEDIFTTALASFKYFNAESQDITPGNEDTEKEVKKEEPGKNQSSEESLPDESLEEDEEL